MSDASLYVTQLTPPGRGAIATLCVEGERAVRVVDRRLTTRTIPFRDQPLGRLIVGRMGPGAGEAVVALRRSEHTVELHCHGGRAAVARIMAVLIEEGCTAIDWRSWTAQQHTDPIAADAYHALADARTERTAAILADQYRGALREAVEAVRVAIDHRDVVTARRQIDELLGRAQLGTHLTTPWQVVLAGEPNVGKSSLINALLGYTRAIVHSSPGTTRDVVTAVTAIDGWPVELADTAGLRQADETIERAGVELAHRRSSQADLVLLVFDASRPWSTADDRLALGWPEAIRVHNKSDLVGQEEEEGTEKGDRHQEKGDRHHLCEAPGTDGTLVGPFRQMVPVPFCSTSALTGAGIDSLLSAIASRLVPLSVAAGAGVPFTKPQISQLYLIRDALAVEDLHAAESLVARFGYA